MDRYLFCACISSIHTSLDHRAVEAEAVGVEAKAVGVEAGAVVGGAKEAGGVGNFILITKKIFFFSAD